jgi:hypothetical protein
VDHLGQNLNYFKVYLYSNVFHIIDFVSFRDWFPGINASHFLLFMMSDDYFYVPQLEKV